MDVISHCLSPLFVRVVSLHRVRRHTGGDTKHLVFDNLMYIMEQNLSNDFSYTFCDASDSFHSEAVPRSRHPAPTSKVGSPNLSSTRRPGFRLREAEILGKSRHSDSNRQVTANKVGGQASSARPLDGAGIPLWLSPSLRGGGTQCVVWASSAPLDPPPPALGPNTTSFLM